MRLGEVRSARRPQWEGGRISRFFRTRGPVTGLITVMNKNIVVAVLALLLVLAAIFGYRAYRDAA